MDERIIKWQICIFIILFISFMPSLVMAKTSFDWFNEGVGLEKVGNYEEVIKAFDEALNINPQYADAWSNYWKVTP